MNIITDVKQQYLKPFNCVKTKDHYWIRLLVLNNNTWNYLKVCKQMINMKYDY